MGMGTRTPKSDCYFGLNDANEYEKLVIVVTNRDGNPMWRKLKVYYGADLETGSLGSGFPKTSSLTKNESDRYALSSWNLNNFSRLPAKMEVETQTTQQKGEEAYLDVNGAVQCTSSMSEEKNLQSTTNTLVIMLKKNAQKKNRLKKKTRSRGRKKKRLESVSEIEGVTVEFEESISEIGGASILSEEKCNSEVLEAPVMKIVEELKLTSAKQQEEPQKKQEEPQKKQEEPQREQDEPHKETQIEWTVVTLGKVDRGKRAMIHTSKSSFGPYQNSNIFTPLRIGDCPKGNNTT
ncbi:hypothetical protein JHK86_004539 [Glycine max]|nr:hypothetical protein JHK86_004539 [Glycine max]